MWLYNIHERLADYHLLTPYQINLCL